MRGSTFFSLAASAATAAAQLKGFNYGSTNTDSSAVTQSRFEDLFTTAQNLVGTSGFTSARLYTMIQAGTTDTAIEAIPAAISTNTKLLLGLWGSAGQADFTDELTALSNAISQYGSSFADLVVGISVGSEDLYRISPTGVEALSGAGAEPATIVDYISQVRSAISGTVLSAAPVGHVDTWTAWVNSTNDAVIDACDFIGMDAYPYFQNTQSNAISSGPSLFQSAYDQTVAAVGSKDVWVTETGWPVSGPTENLAVPSTANAQTYWDDVGCDLLFGKVNTFWYTLQDAYPTTPAPSFGIVGTTLSDTPLYNLTCPAGTSGASSSSSSAAASSSTAVASSVAAVSTPSSSAATAGDSKAATSSVVETPIPSASYASAAGSSSVAVVTTASTTTVAGGKTSTVYQTTLVTITSCSSGCPTTLSSATAAASSATTTVAAVAASSTAAASSAVASCAANLNGDYQFPHLIVPVSSSSPNTAYGTQYDATINSTVSTIFNFDIPESYAGKSCELVFLFPELKDLETSSYTFNNQGGLVSHVLAGVANTSTTYANAPAFAVENGAIPSLVPGSSNVISHDTCPGGVTISFELSSTGGLALEYFEDYNPSPLGLYVVAC